MPSDNELTDPSWPEILRAVQDQLAARLHTALPGIVKSYAVASQTAEIQLAVQLGGENVPPLAEVPVMWPGGAAGFLHVPLAAGDTVMVVFSEEDFGSWYVTGSVSAPSVLARHGLHAVAIPGLRRDGAAFGATGGHVTLAATSMLHLGADNATEFVALASTVTSQLAALKSAINGWAPVANDGGAALKTALTSWIATSSAVAATLVKAK